MIASLDEADIIVATGEALSHCVANTLTDLAGYIDISKVVLLTDCCSNVTGFESLGVEFIEKMTAKGMRVSTSDKFMA